MAHTPKWLLPILAPLAGGSLYSFSNVGFGWWPLVFVFLLPFWAAIDDVKQIRLKTITLIGFLFGLTIFAVGYPWLLMLTGEFLGGGLLLGIILWCGIGVWFAAGFALYAVLYKTLRSANWPQVFAGAFPLILLEWLQPNLFPSYAGAALISEPILAQIADLGGPLLLTAFVSVINSGIYSIGIKAYVNRSFPFLQTTCTVLLFCAVLLYGYHQSISQHPVQNHSAGKALTIGSVQTNLVMLDKQELSLKSHKVHLQQSRELLAQTPVDLLVWPETSYVRGLRRPLPLDAQFIRSDLDVPLLFGGTSVWQKNGQKLSANSVFLANADGKIEQAYDKNQLIPFAEYIPFPALTRNYEENINDLFPHYQAFRAGSHKRPLKLNSISISTPICYEIIHPGFIREMVHESRPELIITLANDAWFGDSQEPWIHLSLARLRAIEHRLWIVRATNSGISAIIDPTGRIISRTGLHTKENLVATVYPERSYSLYTKYGDWVGWLSLAVTLLGLIHLRPFTVPFRKPVNDKKSYSDA